MSNLKQFKLFATLSNKFPKLEWELEDVDCVKASIYIDLYLGEQFMIFVQLSDKEEQMILYIDLMTDKQPMINEYSIEFYSITIRKFEGSIKEIENYISRWLESMHLIFLSFI